MAFLAVVASGAVAALLNPALGEAEPSGEKRGPALSRLLHDGVAAAVAAAAGRTFRPACSGWRKGCCTSTARASPAVKPAKPASDALALLLHTSGTTSKPKTVPIRQRNLVASTAAV